VKKLHFIKLTNGYYIFLPIILEIMVNNYTVELFLPVPDRSESLWHNKFSKSILINSL